MAAKTKAEIVIQEKARNTIMANLIQSEFGVLEENELIEEFIDDESTNAPSQQTYQDNLSTLKSQPQAIMQAPDEIEIEDNLPSVTQGGTAIVKPEIAATKKVKRPRTEIVYYTIKSGDSVSTVAAEHEVSVNTILWENNLSAYSLIRPGNQLAILPITGISHKILNGDTISKLANQYNVEEEKIIEANNLAEDYKLAIGQKLIIPGGRKVSNTTYASASYTGISAIIDLVKPDSAAPTANKMNWPTEGHRITQYYSWRHSGVDIANKVGTPIYAADTGTVESAGWATGYGNTIIIDHGGGKKTRYGHLSKFYVSKGQTVDKGEAIGAMGSTGWSTGSHLHFEVLINGRKYNPLNYIK
ncbi:MAG: peptidoglycan DD-metalloendopeptidase family protein [Patescibacteria group bacterium]